MLIRAIRAEEKDLYNRVVSHPLQSWEWGEFRQETGVNTARVGFFDNGQLKKGIQVTFHQLPVPGFNQVVGYCPRGFMPDDEQLSALKQLGQAHRALFIKLEPNVAQEVGIPSGHKKIAQFLINKGAQPGRPLFTKYTFHLDLTKPEDELFAGLQSKTRYNVNLAYKKGVKIFENTSAEGMEQYISILEETMKRQGFYAHTPEYFRKMWAKLGDSGMLRIFNAVYEDTIIVSWIMFVFNGVIYYPYGSSRDLHRDVMASNLMMWEMIRFGKEIGCHTFDMWGSLGPEPDKKHAWFGFHRFKKGYGGKLMEFVGTYDLVLNEPIYRLYRIAEDLRWKVLRLRARLPF